MAKYDSFIELTPGYESVVDIDSDNRNADFWRKYIVNDDMVTAVKLLSRSLRPDDPNEDVKHYWIIGSYGTGKTYSAIVIKHLLQDDYSAVDNFLSKNSMFCDVKDKFLSARKKGPYYVKFRSGECQQLNTSNKFLFEIEKSVRDILKENNFNYTGRNSLIDSVKLKVKQFRPTLEQSFEDGMFPEFWGIYDSFDDFYDSVLDGNIKACSNAQEVLQSMNIGLATDLDTFKAWLKDVYAGNPELKNTGIFIIWDEFTEYIRRNDLDIIQQLSLFAKELPFFIMYVIHQYPGVFSADVTAGMGKADARFHKIDVSLSEKTTLKLIGESIITRDGMKDKWAEICDELYSSISGSIHAFMGDPDSDLDSNSIKKIFPIHPMTVNLVSKVAGLAASNRSIFEFLKSNGDDSFTSYIHNNGLFDWKWVTLDYLWDYFFVNNQGGKKSLPKTAEDAIKHYNKVRNQISNDRILRVFKGAMLLLATVGSSHSLKKSKNSSGIQASEKTLCDCFTGILSNDEVKKALQTLSKDLGLLVLATDVNDGFRIELPYYGNSGELETEIETLKKQQPLSVLFSNGSKFGDELKKRFVPDERAVIKRLIVETCLGTTQQINAKFVELKKDVEKTYHKFGLLVVVVSNIDEIDKIKTLSMNLLSSDDTKRIMVCVMNHPFTVDNSNMFYELSANAILAQRSGNQVNTNSYQSQATELYSFWLSEALGKEMDLIYGDSPAHLHTNKAVIANYEKIVLKMFPAAPEGFIKKITLYKSPALAPAYYGVTKTTLESKNPADDKQKSFNQQWQDCVDLLKDGEENIWDCNSIEEVIALQKSKIGKSMSALCSHLNKAFTAGTVLLSDLWDELQKELGYYDSSICCYLLGFALHFYIGKYTWFDGNNAHKLDENNISTMLVFMLTGKSAGMKLSSESDIEKRFKEITKRIFGLSLNEIGDVYDCRKNVKIHITKNGYPIWALKYLDDSSYAGIKDIVLSILDKYVEYILEKGNQSDVMEEIVGLVKTNAKVITTLLSELFINKNNSVIGIKNFIYEKAPKTQDVCGRYHFSMDTLFNMLSKTLEEEKWQWEENEVVDVLDRLLLDLTLVGIVNEELDGKAESVEKIRETLTNYLSYIRVPGCIYAGLTDGWAKTVATLHALSINEWVGYDNNKKQVVIDELVNNMKEAIENISQPINVLKKYITNNNLGMFSEQEYNDILLSLPNESFDQTEYSFKTNLIAKIKELAYSKLVAELLKKWSEKTGVKDVSSWMAKYVMPIGWAMPESRNLFAIIYALESNERIDSIRLEKAFEEINNKDFAVLTSKEELNKRFLINVSSNKYVGILLPHINDVKEKIQNAGYRDYKEWDNKIVDIRPIVESYIAVDLKSEVSDKAKKKLEQINDINKLKEQINELLDKSSEACLLLLDED